MNIPSLLHHKKILILGFAREGVSTLSFLQHHGIGSTIAIADSKPLHQLSQSAQHGIHQNKNIPVYLGETYLDALMNFDVVIKTPGISPYLPELLTAKQKGILITSQTALFLERFRNQTIGVTGTKGKSTTATLIHHIFTRAGKAAYLVGNIGNPVLSAWDTYSDRALYVFELSSHQLHDVTVSPHGAVLLNIVPEHLDYYPSFDAYAQAKSHITLYQIPGDFVVCSTQQQQSFAIAQKSSATKLLYGNVCDTHTLCCVVDDCIMYGTGEKKECIIRRSQIPLLGDFNLDNIMPAIIVAKKYGIDTDIIRTAIASFQPLPTRLEKVGVYRGITFYDDSLATVPQATIAALGALGKSVATLIAGGYERQQDYRELAKAIGASNVTTLILFPTTGERIWREVEKMAHVRNKITSHFVVSTMEEAIQLVYQHTPTGTICLLSNAAPSFNMFKDYMDKSQQYRKYIQKYAISSQ